MYQIELETEGNGIIATGTLQQMIEELLHQDRTGLWEQGETMIIRNTETREIIAEIEK